MITCTIDPRDRARRARRQARRQEPEDEHVSTLERELAGEASTACVSPSIAREPRTLRRSREPRSRRPQVRAGRETRRRQGSIYRKNPRCRPLAPAAGRVDHARAQRDRTAASAPIAGTAIASYRASGGTSHPTARAVAALRYATAATRVARRVDSPREPREAGRLGGPGNREARSGENECKPDRDECECDDCEERAQTAISRSAMERYRQLAERDRGGEHHPASVDPR